MTIMECFQILMKELRTGFAMLGTMYALQLAGKIEVIIPVTHN